MHLFERTNEENNINRLIANSHTTYGYQRINKCSDYERKKERHLYDTKEKDRKKKKHLMYGRNTKKETKTFLQCTSRFLCTCSNE